MNYIQISVFAAYSCVASGLSSFTLITKPSSWNIHSKHKKRSLQTGGCHTKLDNGGARLKSIINPIKNHKAVNCPSQTRATKTTRNSQAPINQRWSVHTHTVQSAKRLITLLWMYPGCAEASKTEDQLCRNWYHLLHLLQPYSAYCLAHLKSDRSKTFTGKLQSKLRIHTATCPRLGDLNDWELVQL